MLHALAAIQTPWFCTTRVLRPLFSAGTSGMDIKRGMPFLGAAKRWQFIFLRYNFRHLVVALRLELLQDVVGWNQNVVGNTYSECL